MQDVSWLALETSTDVVSLALARGTQVWSHTLEGGAKSSAHTLPEVRRMMREAELSFSQLQAVVFGRGPGAFTGLRTACSVAQGLAFAASLKVLPIDTLLAVAEAARAQRQAPDATVLRVLSVLDARMDQVYAAAYEHTDTGWRCMQAAEVMAPEAVHWPPHWGDKGFVCAGNAHALLEARAPAPVRAQLVLAWPSATALLRLAPQAWRDGLAVAPDAALPLYIRDKVAQTTAERAQATIQP